MQCKEFRKLMIAHLADDDPDREGSIRQHVSGCADCKKTLEKAKEDRKCLASTPPGDVLAAVFSRLDSDYESIQRPQISRLIFWPALALAAAGLLFVIVTKFVIPVRDDPSVSDQDTNSQIMRASRNADYIMRLEPGKQQIVIQSMEDFDLALKDIGSTLGEYKLEEVKTEVIVLSDGKGNQVEYTLGRWNRETLKKVEQESQILAKLYKGGELAGKFMDRLESLAYFGDNAALSLVRKIAREQSVHTGRAREIVANAGNADTIRKVFESARSGSQASRIKSIHALGRIHSPVTLQYLKELASSLTDEYMGKLCLDKIKERDSSGAARALDWVIKNGKNAAVKQTAQQYIKTLKERNS
ncbi:anti-sigma factor family protein [Planctomycetota bacterium]